MISPTMPQFIQVLNQALRRMRDAYEPALTWGGLASELGINRSTLWHALNDGDRKIKDEDLLAILKRLRCSLDEQIFIFKLQGSIHPIEQDTAEQWAITWVKSPPPQTEPVTCTMQKARKIQEKAAENA